MSSDREEMLPCSQNSEVESGIVSQIAIEWATPYGNSFYGDNLMSQFTICLYQRSNMLRVLLHFALDDGLLRAATSNMEPVGRAWWRAEARAYCMGIST